MEESEAQLTVEELAELIGISVRTIRYYISEGLLPGPGARGKAAFYGEEHLLRLRLIRLFSRQHVPLVEMRDLLTRLSLGEIRALLAEEEERAAQLEQAAQAPPPEEYVATLLRNARAARQPYTSPLPAQLPYPSGSDRARKVQEPSPPHSPAAPLSVLPPAPEQWQRWELAPGVELHVKVSSEDQHCSLLERLFRTAGKVYPRSNRQ